MEMRVSGAVSMMARGPMTGPKSAKWNALKSGVVTECYGDRVRPRGSVEAKLTAVLGLVTDIFAPLSAML